MGSSWWFDVTALLQPKMAIDGTSLDQCEMRPDVEDPTTVEHENLIAINERGETV